VLHGLCFVLGQVCEWPHDAYETLLHPGC
jgi:hypothetical protein